MDENFKKHSNEILVAILCYIIGATPPYSHFYKKGEGVHIFPIKRKWLIKKGVLLKKGVSVIFILTNPFKCYLSFLFTSFILVLVFHRKNIVLLHLLLINFKRDSCCGLVTGGVNIYSYGCVSLLAPECVCCVCVCMRVSVISN